ncbi:MAG: hypothetical protein WBD81_04835 [Collimonas pratensis]|uniref:hypothetical protein n=1 Tax=Collimonas pratensis TaxID=279113 RepID=UPI003C73A092
MPPRYQEWLQHVFERPLTPNGWYFDLEDVEFKAEHADITLLVAHTLENCGRDFDNYSLSQLSFGLRYIFNNSCSDVIFSLMDDAVPLPLRLRVIASVKILYRDCFTPKCAPVLGHVDEPGANPLNGICYMLWDDSPLAWWENRPHRPVFYDALADVLGEVLGSSNPACVESALHGLGHMLPNYIERVTEVITGYQRRNIFLSPQIKAYAQRASTGNIQ